MKTTIHVEGMMCNHCKMHVEKALSGVQGVKKAQVDLAKGIAVVESAAILDEKVLKQAVADAGYKATKIGE
jgi:copper chaperone CopZ